MTETTDIEPAAGPTDDESLSTDTVYRVLSDKRRRYALHYLKQRKEPVSVRELAEQVAAWENDKAVDELTSQERKRVYIALYQSHLPTLHKEGVVAYDADRGRVELSAAMRNREIFLEVVPRGSVPWSRYYIGLSLVDAVLLVLAWLEVYPFNLLPNLWWGAVIILTFAASALFQIYSTRNMRFGDEGPPPELKSLR